MMTISTATLLQFQQFLMILIPPLANLIGLYLAALLKQDHFPEVVNALISWVTLIVMAVLSAWTNHQLSSNLSTSGLITLVSGIVTLLLAGPFSRLRPFLHLAWVQTNPFNLVQLQPQMTVAQQTPAPVQLQTAAAQPQMTVAQSTLGGTTTTPPFHDGPSSAGASAKPQQK